MIEGVNVFGLAGGDDFNGGGGGMEAIGEAKMSLLVAAAELLEMGVLWGGRISEGKWGKGLARLPVMA